MDSKTFNLDVSFGQIAVFWSSLEKPFNDWTQRHVDQGFAWRHGSVSFRALVESGRHSVQVDVTDHAGPLQPSVIRAIEVPFEVPPERSIAIASISDLVTITLREGSYSLRCELLGPGNDGTERVRLVFATDDIQHFAVVRADTVLRPGHELLTHAVVAAS